MLTYNIRGFTGKKTEFIYENIKNDIRTGELKAGEKLPSKRAFAEHLGISVITVENAYAMLEEEGYIESRARSGFYVRKLNLLSEFGEEDHEWSALRNRTEAGAVGRNRAAMGKENQIGTDNNSPAFRNMSESGIYGRDRSDSVTGIELGMVDGNQAAIGSERAAGADDRARVDADSYGKKRESVIRYLPEEQAYRFEDSKKIPQGMVKIMRQLMSDRPEILLEKPPHMGCAVLRNALADYLRRYRGMKVQPGNIVIGSGAEYLYGMLVQLFGRDRVIGIEYPSYEKIEQVYISNGAQTEHLKMAEDGISSDSLSESRADILHVSPYHSYPTGITASASKRYEYLSWAGSRDGYLIEDDFDSEFAFVRKPIEPMFSMDRSGRVIYLNTFSKSLAPSIRVAYMVLPDRLMLKYSEKLGFYSCTVPVFDQYVLAEYIGSGAFERHLNRIRREILRDNA